jgi:hypothetical protein
MLITSTNEAIMNKRDAQSHVDGNRKAAEVARKAGHAGTANFRERLANAIEREHNLKGTK